VVYAYIGYHPAVLLFNKKLPTHSTYAILQQIFTHVKEKTI